jgi:hypothetical protein
MLLAKTMNKGKCRTPGERLQGAGAENRPAIPLGGVRAGLPTGAPRATMGVQWRLYREPPAIGRPAQDAPSLMHAREGERTGGDGRVVEKRGRLRGEAARRQR